MTIDEGNATPVTEAEIDASEFASFKEKFDYKKASGAIDQLAEAAKALQSLPEDHYRADFTFDLLYEFIGRFHEHMFYLFIDPTLDPRHSARPKGYKSREHNQRTILEDDTFI